MESDGFEVLLRALAVIGMEYGVAMAFSECDKNAVGRLRRKR